MEGVGSKIPYLGYTVLSFQLGHVEKEEAIKVPFLVSTRSIRCPIIGTNVMQEIMEGEDSIEEKIKKLTQF